MRYVLNFSCAVVLLNLVSTGFAGGLPEKMPNTPMAIEASDAGIYLGLNAGGGFTGWKETDGSSAGIDGLVVKRVTHDCGFVGRIFLGYDINRYFAAEAGYSYFFNRPVIKAMYYSVEVASAGIRTQAVDFYVKGKLPVYKKLDLYAKAGAGYLISNQGQMVGGIFNNTNLACGFGADYSFTQNIIANIEWSRIAGYPTMNTNYIPNVYAVMAGLRYKFNM